MQIDDTPKSQLIFGVDVEGLRPEEPLSSMNTPTDIRFAACGSFRPATILCRPFCTAMRPFTAADGKTVKLPMDRGEGQQWSIAPGNLYSKPRKIAHWQGRRAGQDCNGPGDPTHP